MSSATGREEDKSDIPLQLYDAQSKTTYKRLRFFGKGGFAKCYEIVDVSTSEIYAGKIVSKKLMMKHNQKEKMTQEISIHKALNHPNIVKFFSFFDDQFNVYIVLELCKKRSMMELHKRRKVITDYECRFYIHQIIQGVKYLHDHRIIHRDLKLGNLFLDDNLHVKIGDFGLAARIEYEGERKKTLCGTPNYIAPEVLSKKGHSYEVDIWSIGCVMYTLLVGQPPFETKNLKETYNKIRKCDYRVPISLRKPAATMIIAMLQSDPEKRPTISQLLTYEYLANNYIPVKLPIACLTMAPRADQLEETDRVNQNRRPLVELNGMITDELREGTFLRQNLHDTIAASALMTPHINASYRSEMERLHSQLKQFLELQPIRINGILGDEATDPNAQPLFWISKWVDYSDKYGFGYQLCDEGMGVMYNDTTKLIMLSNGINIHAIDKDGRETYFTVNDFPGTMEKKVKLLTYFKRYMNEHLVKTGANAVVAVNDPLSRVPHLHTWFRTTCAVVMHLTNGTVQLNFSDHIKIILCPHMAALTYIDNDKNFRTFKFSTLLKGCPNDIYQKIRYAHEKITKVIEKLSV